MDTGLHLHPVAHALPSSLPGSGPGAPPALLRLAPGLRVVRRGRDRLQVGLHPDRHAVLPRTPAAERVLGRLLDLLPVDPHGDPEAADVLARLDEADCLEAVPAPRPAAQVAVIGSLAGLDPAALLESAGIEPTTRLDRADAALVLHEGELHREVIDPLVRRGIEHVVVRLLDGGAVIGPFVSPGLTACLRCIDAHTAEHDPEHPVVCARYARATERVRSDGTDDAGDPFLAPIAARLAARDLHARLAGRQPATWSRTLHLGPDPARVEAHDWLRHPRCGCTWSPH